MPVLDEVAKRLLAPECGHLQAYFTDETTLVPIPRSSPLPDNALWPARVICERLRLAGLGREISPCIARTKAIPKSSGASGAANRPSVQDQYDSLAVSAPDLFVPARITLIDDVLTLGRTSFACAMRLHEAFPNAELRLFAVIRTKGFEPELTKFVDPEIGVISYSAYSGKTNRQP